MSGFGDLIEKGDMMAVYQAAHDRTSAWLQRTMRDMPDDVADAIVMLRLLSEAGQLDHYRQLCITQQPNDGWYCVVSLELTRKWPDGDEVTDEEGTKH